MCFIKVGYTADGLETSSGIGNRKVLNENDSIKQDIGIVTEFEPSSKNVKDDDFHNLKQQRKQIKAQLDQEQVADLLTYIGYEVSRDFKFKLRPDERTPSASIRADGFLKDFGDGWSGDIVALLHEHHEQSLKDAMEYVATCLGVRYE